MSAPLRILQMATVRWYNACAEYAVRVAEGLAASGHEVFFLGFPGSPVVAEARRRGLRTVEDIDLRPGRLDGPAMAWRLTQLVRRHDLQIVNAHRAEDHLFAALAKAGRPGLRIVRTRGDVRPPRRGGLNRLLYERRTSAHILAAAFMRDRFYDGFRIPDDRIRVIPPAVDLAGLRDGAPSRAEARSLLGLPSDRPIVGVVGRWTAAKGLPVALEAFAAVHRRHPEVLFMLAGDPYDVSRESLEEQARAGGLGASLVLLPRRSDVRPLIRALDVGIVASVASEAICRVAMEFLTLGTPVIGTALNSIPEIVPHDEAGWIVPPGDAPALAAAIERLLEDGGLRARLASAAPDVADRRFDTRRLIDDTEALYRTLLERTP